MTLADTTPRGSRRRRLWQLPATAHDLLLAMGLPAPQLQRSVQQALGRLHRARCSLQGSGADLLYSVVHDMGTRNALSEALHRALDARHSRALHHLAALREEPALRQAWAAALCGDGVPGVLWALLTHPQGAALQDRLLYDARHWVFARAQEALACASRAQAEAHERDALKAEIDRLHLRLRALNTEREQQHQASQAELARLRGLLQTAPLLPAPRGADGEATPALPRPLSAPALRPAAVMPSKLAAQAVEPHACDKPARPAPPGLEGRRVLCVGGMPGAQARYRGIVEAAGARFDFHDGGIEHSVHRLDEQLGAADLVVCQAGCVNHEAYRRVKGHCRRLDKTCLFVERPSVSHFARSLGVAARGTEVLA